MINRIIPSRPADRLRYAAHVLAWIPLVVLILDYFSGNLTANPIQAATQRTGQTAITLLATSLSFTPINLVTRWRIVLPLRRTFGLYAFLYALLHMGLFSVVDYGLDFELILGSILSKPYIIVGTIGFIILTLMAATSFKWWMKKMWKNWKKLHSLVYPAALILGLHFAWALKGDIFRLSGDIFWPLVYLISVSIFLVIRIPSVKALIQRKLAYPSRRIITTPPEEKSSP